ncbi:hypothetical protein DICVIV_04307 [Dictyocaulus viviparus]|uniref:Uncharacterized protein n=1 Tax=Dictyocaulus viviparus TaxID=29172 RepID=A0A0D8XYK2_DICVI|nr:hypothetical protein DICVIV_04307 [Dictyocaulus viviparus]
MEQFDENTFFEQLETVMPKKLEALTIYGNYFPLKKSKKYGQWRKFEILFGSMIPQVRTKWWMKEECILMSHLVRSSPYKIFDDFRPTRNTAGSWRFDQASMDNENIRQERQNAPVNRILRFMQMFTLYEQNVPFYLSIGFDSFIERNSFLENKTKRPEGVPPAPIIAPRVLPEIPPPPRRERLRVRPNVPTVPEERSTAPIAIPPDGTMTAPVAVVMPVPPSQVVASVPTASQPPTSTSLSTAPVSVGQLTAPAMQTYSQVPTANLNISAQAQLPRSQDGVDQTRQNVQIEELPADTTTPSDQPQAIVSSPQEIAVVATQPASPDSAQTTSTPNLVVGAETPNSTEQQQVLQRNDVATFSTRSENVPRHGENDRNHVEENINMVLQGMLQALVEEIVFDAVNEDRMENPSTDPSPAVSSNATLSTTATPSTPSHHTQTATSQMTHHSQQQSNNTQQ